MCNTIKFYKSLSKFYEEFKEGLYSDADRDNLRLEYN